MSEEMKFEPGVIFHHPMNQHDYLFLTREGERARCQLLSDEPAQATDHDLILGDEETPAEFAPWSVRCHSDFSLTVPDLPEGAKIWDMLEQEELERAKSLHEVLWMRKNPNALNLRRGITRPRDLLQAMDLQAAQEAHAQLLSAQLKAARVEGVMAFLERCRAFFEGYSAPILECLEGVETLTLQGAGAGAQGAGASKLRSEKFIRAFEGKEYELEVQLKELGGQLRIRHQARSKAQAHKQERILPIPCQILMYHPDQEAPVVNETVTLNFDLEDCKKRLLSQKDLLDVLKHQNLSLDDVEIIFHLPKDLG